MSSLKVAALFPGQGSQYPGMAKELVTHFPFAVQIYEEASDTLKHNLLKLCLEGPADELQMTSNAQPAILVTSYAWFQVLRRNLDFSPITGAGHSLGEYSALVSAGAMTLSEAVKLVRTRGELMQAAVPVGKGKMAAIIGLDDAKVEELCRLASDGDTSTVVPANYNAPSQVVVAGHAGAVDKLVEVSNSPEHPELKARKIIPLNVSAPFHSPLMKGVADKFLVNLEAVDWNTPTFSIVANLDAKLHSYPSGSGIAEVLKDQVDHSVLWTGCVKTVSNHGATHYVEMGPGKVLGGLVKRILEEPKISQLDSLADFKAFETLYLEA